MGEDGRAEGAREDGDRGKEGSDSRERAKGGQEAA